MAADETTTWGEVCKKVGFSDNLYRTCREKVSGFDGLGLGGLDEMDPDDDYDFDAEIKGHLQPIPEPPGSDWTPPPEADPAKWIMYGMAALFAGAILLGGKKSAGGQTASTGVTSPKAA